MKKTSYTVSDASVKRYFELRETEAHEGDTWACFEEWTENENFSKGAAYWDAMKIICRKDKAFLSEAIFSFQMAQQKLDQISSAFDVINRLTKEEG
jgi:N-glycosylase/DNA lyase